MHGLAGLWDALETECVHECCGIDAFDLAPASIRRAVPQSMRREAFGHLSAFRSYVASLAANAVLVSERLNQLLHRDLMLGVIDHLVASLDDRAPPDSTPGTTSRDPGGGER